MNGDDKNIDKNAKDKTAPETTGAKRSFDPMFAQQWQKPAAPKTPQDTNQKPTQPTAPSKPQQPAAMPEAAAPILPGEPMPPLPNEAEDVLFEVAGNEPVAEDATSFDENGRSKWEGRALTPDEMGVATPSQPGFMAGDDELAIDSEQELELIDGYATPDTVGKKADDVTPQDGEGSEEIALDDQPVEMAQQGDDLMEGEVYVLDEGESVEGAEGVVAESAEGEHGGEVVSEDGEVVEEQFAQDDEPMEHPDLDDVEAPSFEEEFATQSAHVEDTEQGEEHVETESAEPIAVAVAPARTGRIFKLFTKVAVAAALVVGGGVVVLHPEWVGLTLEPELVERVQVARPNTTPRVPKPVAPVTDAQPAVPGVETAPVQPSNVEQPQPQPQQTAQVELQPAVTPAPVIPTPAEPQAEGNVADQLAANSTLPRYLPAGESLWIGQYDGGSRGTAEWASVAPGSKAFAQLENGNFFIGSVKAVAADALVLSVKQGEVMLPRAEIRKVTTLDSRDYADLQRATQGFLKLSNDNRLVGEILETVGDDHYVLQMHSDRIVIPRSEVQQVVQRGGKEGLRFGSLGDEEQWLRDVAGRQLESQRTGTDVPTKGRASTQGQATEPQIPVKQEQRKVPSSSGK